MDGRAMYTPMTLFYTVLALKSKVAGGMWELLQFVNHMLENNVDKFRQRLSWDAICWLFGLTKLQDELVVVQYQFDYEFPEDGNPYALGFSSPTSLLVVDHPSSSLSESGITSLNFSAYHQNLDIIRNFYFDQLQHTYNIFLLKSRWDELSDQATITLAMVGGGSVTGMETNHMLNMKRDVKSVSTLPTIK